MGHKRFAPSSAKRDMLCVGAVAMIEALPESERDSGDNIHSRRGTCAHTVGEMCLEAIRKKSNSITTPSDYLGMEVEGIVVDEKIVDGATMYVDYCRPIVQHCNKVGFVQIERSYDFEKPLKDAHDLGIFLTINGKDMGGTGDLTAGIFWGTLYIVDYKNGRGVVEVERVPQLIDYAYGVLAAYDDEYEFEEVVLVIVQPNANHVDGPIREYRMTVKEVNDFIINERLPKVERSLEACKIKQEGGDISEYLNPGEEQCMWCPSKARCNKAIGGAFESVGIELIEDDFEDFYTISLPDPNFITSEQEMAILNYGDQIISFVEAVRNRKHKLAEHGNHTIGWKLVNINTHRKLRDGMEPKMTKELKKLGIRTSDYLVAPKIKSPAQIEKALKDKGVEKETSEEFSDRFFFKPDGGTHFVPESASGKAVKPAIDADFEELFDDDEEDLLA